MPGQGFRHRWRRGEMQISGVAASVLVIHSLISVSPALKGVVAVAAWRGGSHPHNSLGRLEEVLSNPRLCWERRSHPCSSSSREKSRCLKTQTTNPRAQQLATFHDRARFPARPARYQGHGAVTERLLLCAQRALGFVFGELSSAGTKCSKQRWGIQLEVQQ